MILEASQSQIFWLVIFAVGAFLLFAGIMRKPIIKLPGGQLTAAALGFILLVFGFVWGFAPFIGQYEAPITVVTTPPTTTVTAPQFDVRIATASPTGAVGTTGFSTPATTDTDLRALVSPNRNASVYGFNGSEADQVLNFTFTPVAVGSGMDTTTLATLYFKVEHLAKFQGEYVFSERTAGERDCLFEWGTTASGLVGSEYEAGSYHVAMTDSGYVSLTMVYDTGADSYGEEVNGEELGDAGATYRITFYNADNSWSKVYTVTTTLLQ
jgi:hypothetical protein